MYILFLCVIGLFSVEVKAQVPSAQDTTSLASRVERLAREQELRRLKSYYNDIETANLCKSWNSCSKFAFEQYEKDQQFKIIKARLKDVTVRHRHSVHKEKRLYIQAMYGEKTVNIMFLTPRISVRTETYQYISSFPAK